MTTPFPTQRLSPKNQVTLLKGARALAGIEREEYLCGTTHRMRSPESGEWFPVVVLMTEQELQERENAIRDKPDLDPAMAEVHIARLNGMVQRLNIDKQRRIVLPPHFVAWLKLEREAYMFSTNNTVLVWHPDDWRRWAGVDQEADASAPGDGPPLLMI